ncbi:galectin-3-binding protein A-like [Takifugu flavidus]|uniref:galectin-3-binding protein A-like n=1 Tax=Takifugu flavidus TaxID=433684 RepID=UPI0025449B28|nr:galectin-3-binding protein A-like [Takifugu flavidus]XP_056895211.1 galectin-3-binding protein A-like [Takifugu flavidus]XP_056895212.1 galectin-3-binding protein A-like [Takifugu flavidus]
MGLKGNRLLYCCILLLSIGLSADGSMSKIRLVGGKDLFEGRLEILHDGVWGTVCDDGWGVMDAEVVCHQLGFSGVDIDADLATVSRGSGPIWLDEMNCNGNELDLTHCEFPGWGIHNCQHDEDVRVRCIQEVTEQVPFVFQDASWAGRLRALFESGSDCDVGISVVEDGRHVDPICAHRLILHQHPNIRDSQRPLSISTTSNCSQHARAFVRYFYTGEVTFNLSSYICILKMASDWGLKDFQNETTNIVLPMLAQDNTFQAALSVYEYALSPFDEALMGILLHYLAWNFESLVSTPTWTDLPLSAVKELLTRSDLVVKTETIVLQSLEKWATAQGMTAVPQELLQLIRFPMIPAKDLSLLTDPQYQPGRCEGLQFQAMPYPSQSSNFTESNSSRPRMYTAIPWSYNINHVHMEYLRNQRSPGQGRIIKTFDFQTPFHNSAPFTYSKANWELSLNLTDDRCRDDPLTAADLNLVLNLTMRDVNSRDQLHRCIRFSNSLIAQCDGRSVVSIDDLVEEAEGRFVYQPGQAGVIFPCKSNKYSYRVVIGSECIP